MLGRYRRHHAGRSSATRGFPAASWSTGRRSTRPCPARRAALQCVGHGLGAAVVRDADARARPAAARIHVQLNAPTGCRTAACGRRWPNGWAMRNWSPLLHLGVQAASHSDDAVGLPMAERAPARRASGGRSDRWVTRPAASGTRGVGACRRGHRRRRLCPRGRHGRRSVPDAARPSSPSVRTARRRHDAHERVGHWEADSVIGAGCSLHAEVEQRATSRGLMAIRAVPAPTGGRARAGRAFAAWIILRSALRCAGPATRVSGTARQRPRLQFVPAAYGRRDSGSLAREPRTCARPYSGCMLGEAARPSIAHDPRGMLAQTLPTSIRMDLAKEVRAIVRRDANIPLPCACSATARPPRRSPTNC